MNEANVFVEKRVHPRLSVKIPVKYYLAQDEGEIEHIVEWRQQDKNAQTLDLSLSGMHIAIDQKFPVGSVIRFDMSLPDRPNGLTVFAEVIWANDEGAGLHFIEMLNEDVECLKAYMGGDSSAT